MIPRPLSLLLASLFPTKSPTETKDFTEYRFDMHNISEILRVIYVSVMVMTSLSISFRNRFLSHLHLSSLFSSRCNKHHLAKCSVHLISRFESSRSEGKLPHGDGEGLERDKEPSAPFLCSLPCTLCLC